MDQIKGELMHSNSGQPDIARTLEEESLDSDG